MYPLTSLILLGSLALTHGCWPEPGAINLARNGEASQDSVFKHEVIGYPRYAIDGNRNGNHHKGSCAHTGGGVNTWWKVNLKKAYKITTVIITNRQDCCSERLRGAEIRVGNYRDNNNPVCGMVTDVSSATLIFCCHGMEGQFVSVVMPDRRELMSLCEVEVYGKPIGKP